MWKSPIEEAHKQKTGAAGEDAATMFLVEHGFKLVERNYRRPLGEIDIICKYNKILVFCEVKTRVGSDNMEFFPEQNVHARKRRKLQKICELYLWEKRYPIQQEWRIDVISVIIDKFTEQVKINHIENAVWQKMY